MVEGARLEIVYAVKRIGGSNPPLSASNGQISRSSPARAAFSLLSRSVSKEKRALAHSVSEKSFILAQFYNRARTYFATK